MHAKTILAIDQGTSATKAVLVGADGQIIARCDAQHAQVYPHPGWVEHNPKEIVLRVSEAVRAVLSQAGFDGSQIAAVSVSNQRETVMIWDRATGEPVYPAIVWQCNRAESICQRMEACGLADMVQQRTGLVLSPYFSAAKMAWILENIPGTRERAERGELAAGTMDSWIVWHLTGGAVHATDWSNASRTQLLNINKLCWDPDLLEAFGLPASLMPKILDSDGPFGQTTIGGILPSPVPITGVMGDSHAALFGQLCFSRGMVKTTYGTGSSIMMNIGSKPLKSESGLVTSIAWGRQGQVDYVLEGNLNCTGAVIKWLVEDLGLISSPREAATLSASVADTDGVYLVPAFVGLGAPYWESRARASICGMTRGTGKAQVVRAAEECIAYQVKDIVDRMATDTGFSILEMRVDGGPTRDTFLMQFQADMLNLKVTAGHTEELSARGAALMAGLSIGIWKDTEALEQLLFPATVFNSQMDEATRSRLYTGWKSAVAGVLAACK